MSNNSKLDKLEMLGKEIIELSKTNTIFSEIAERSFINIHNFILTTDFDDYLNNDLDENEELPPQIRENGNQENQIGQQSVHSYGQFIPLIGNQANTMMMMQPQNMLNFYGP